MSTRTLLTLLVAGLALTGLTGIALAMQTAEPLPTPIEVIETGQAAWTALTAGSWVLGMGLMLTLIIQAFRAPFLNIVFNAVPKRWRVSIPLALSGVASALMYLAGDMPPELAALLTPAIGGVAILTHEAREAVTGKRGRKLTPAPTGVVSAFLIAGIISTGCAMTPPLQPLGPQMVPTETAGVMRIDVDVVADPGELSRWCRQRQERRWWSSAMAQAGGVLSGGLAAAALARDDDNIELGLQLGSVTTAAIAAGAAAYSGEQAGAHEQHCGGAL